MDVKSVKKEIEQNDIAVTGQMNAFTCLQKDIIAEIKLFVASELKRLVENEVSRNSDHTKSLSKENLGEMKRRYNQILESSGDTVDSLFTGSELWLHIDYKIITNDEAFEQSFISEKKAEENIMRGISLALGQAGQILIDYGYEDMGTKYGRFAEIEFHGKKRLAYQNIIILSDSLEKLLQEYCQGIGNLHRLLENNLNLKQNINEQEVLDLWSNV